MVKIFTHLYIYAFLHPFTVRYERSKNVSVNYRNSEKQFAIDWRETFRQNPVPWIYVPDIAGVIKGKRKSGKGFGQGSWCVSAQLPKQPTEALLMLCNKDVHRIAHCQSDGLFWIPIISLKESEIRIPWQVLQKVIKLHCLMKWFNPSPHWRGHNGPYCFRAIFFCHKFIMCKKSATKISASRILFCLIMFTVHWLIIILSSLL